MKGEEGENEVASKVIGLCLLLCSGLVPDVLVPFMATHLSSHKDL